MCPHIILCATLFHLLCIHKSELSIPCRVSHGQLTCLFVGLRTFVILFSRASGDEYSRCNFLAFHLSFMSIFVDRQNGELCVLSIVNFSIFVRSIFRYSDFNSAFFRYFV